MTGMRSIAVAGVVTILLLCSANARPRDDVMAGLFRCNALETDRQWLDCYYGVAQPARASLGLKSALPSQIQLAQTLPPAAGNTPSALRSRVIADAGRCYDQDKDRDWLDCFYRAAWPMRAQLGLTVPSESPAAQPQIAKSGDGRSAAPARAMGNVTGRMAKYWFDGQQIFTVTLDNGQTWRQIDGDSRTAFWTRPAGSYVVTIRPGMSGSFMLSVQDEARVFRVRRIS